MTGGKNKKALFKAGMTCRRLPQKPGPAVSRPLSLKGGKIMSGPDIIYADPWLRKGGKDTRLPGDARLACAYELYLVVDWFDEAAFFRRTEKADELWIGSGDSSPERSDDADETACAGDFEAEKLSDIGCVYTVRRKGDERVACVRLLERLFRARVGFAWPDRFVAPGIVDRSGFENLVGRIEKELNVNREKARSRETGIVRAARELGLFPQPTGTGPGLWQVRCPGTGHPLYINAAVNEFGCGWCRRKGGIKELRAFVNERKKGIK